MQQKCYSCLFRQAIDAAWLLTDDAIKREAIIRGAGCLMSETDFQRTPPEIGSDLHRMIRDVLKDDDPYRKIKDEMNLITKSIRPILREKVVMSSNPLETAIRFSIAGNIIDFSTFNAISADKIVKTVEDAAKQPIMGSGISALYTEITKPQNQTLLYICDNCGEIVWDALLIEQLQKHVSVTVAVRGGAVVNDATLADAEFAGITDLCPVITTGCDIPGIVPEATLQKEPTLCSAEFREHFLKADIVLAKGQGNLETIQPAIRPVFHLFMVKCSVIEKLVNIPRGALVVLHS